MNRTQQVTIAWMLTVAIGLCAGPTHAQQKGWPRDGAIAADWAKGSPLLADLDGDQHCEVILAREDNRLCVYRDVGTTYPTQWPVTLGFDDGSISSPAVGDIDGDGHPEIVVVGDSIDSTNCRVEVYRTSGTLMGALDLNNGSQASGKATPCLFNCMRYIGSTAHAGLEIILRDGDGQMHFVWWDGSALQDKYSTSGGTYDTVSSDVLKDRFGGQFFTSSPAVVATASNKAYVVVGSTDGKIYRWEITSGSGDSSQNWDIQKLTALSPTGASGAKFLSSPVLEDFDGDGDYEIIVGGDNGYMYVLEGSGSGSDYSGWPQATTQAILSSAALADLDGDGHKEILCGSNDGAVYVWNTAGQLVAGSPLVTGGNVISSPAAAELDGQAGLEIVATSLDGYVYVWNRLGQLLTGWPKKMNTELYASPALGAMHSGSHMSIVCAGLDGHLFVFDLAVNSLNPLLGWPQFRGGPQRRGTY